MATVRKETHGNSIIRLEIPPFSTRVTDDLPPEQLNRKYAITEHVGKTMIFRNTYKEGSFKTVKNVLTARVKKHESKSKINIRKQLFGLNKKGKHKPQPIKVKPVKELLLSNL